MSSSICSKIFLLHYIVGKRCFCRFVFLFLTLCLPYYIHAYFDEAFFAFLASAVCFALPNVFVSFEMLIMLKKTFVVVTCNDGSHIGVHLLVVVAVDAVCCSSSIAVLHSPIASVIDILMFCLKKFKVYCITHYSISHREVF